MGGCIGDEPDLRSTQASGKLDLGSCCLAWIVEVTVHVVGPILGISYGGTMEEASRMALSGFVTHCEHSTAQRSALSIAIGAIPA